MYSTNYRGGLLPNEPNPPSRLYLWTLASLGMEPKQLVDAICAAHLAHLVEGQLEQRGGLFLVGPPGALKSTLTEALSQYPDTLLLSDVNITSLLNFRDALTGGSVNTLVFTEYAKIYERNPATAINVEGTLRALASEGFAAASFEDQRIARRRAFATVIGAMPPRVQDRHYKRWDESGFNRRFLWAVYGLKGAHILDDAASNLERLDFGIKDVIRVPPIGRNIPMMLSNEERKRTQMLVKHQPGNSHTQQIQLLIRIWAVLKWWNIECDTPQEAEATIEAFAESLSREGTDLDLTAQTPVLPLARKAKK